MTDIVRRVLIREEARSADKKTCEIQVLQQKCVSTHVQIRSSCFSESIESIKRFFLKLRLCYSFYYMVICVNYILLEAMRTVEELQKARPGSSCAKSAREGGLGIFMMRACS